MGYSNNIFGTNRYTKTAVILHWLIAIAIFGMFALGWYMSDLPKEAMAISQCKITAVLV